MNKNDWVPFKWAMLGWLGLILVAMSATALYYIDIPATMDTMRVWTGLTGFPLVMLSLFPTVIETMGLLVTKEDRQEIMMMSMVRILSAAVLAWDVITNYRYIAFELRPSGMGFGVWVDGLITGFIAWLVAMGPEVGIAAGLFLFVWTTKSQAVVVAEISKGTMAAWGGASKRLEAVARG